MKNFGDLVFKTIFWYSNGGTGQIGVENIKRWPCGGCLGHYLDWDDVSSEKNVGISCRGCDWHGDAGKYYNSGSLAPPVGTLHVTDGELV